MCDCVAEVERDKLFSLPENERGDAQLEHGDLRNRETVQDALERADKGALDLLHLGGVEKVSDVLSCV